MGLEKLKKTEKEANNYTNKSGYDLREIEEAVFISINIRQI